MNYYCTNRELWTLEQCDVFSQQRPACASPRALMRPAAPLAAGVAVAAVLVCATGSMGPEEAVAAGRVFVGAWTCARGRRDGCRYVPPGLNARAAQPGRPFLSSPCAPALRHYNVLALLAWP